MTTGTQLVTIEPVALKEVAGKLGHTRPFADVPADALQSFSLVDRVKAKTGAILTELGYDAATITALQEKKVV